MSRKRKPIWVLFTVILITSFIFTAIRFDTLNAQSTSAVDVLQIPKISVEPDNKTDLTLTPPAEKYSLTLRPDGDGYWDEWYGVPDDTNHYTNWDEATTDDADYNWIDDEYWVQTSTLQNHTAESWSIAKVKLTIRAKSNQYSDDRLYVMLRIGGKDYDGWQHTNVSTSWIEYTCIWGMNPATQDQWTWSEIDELEAGVWTESGDDVSWDSGLEIYVSQLYVEVFGPGIKFDISVDYVTELWQWEFELYFDPDVLHGVYADEGNEWPAGTDPDGFLASEGGTITRAGGPGWNNTLGKLWQVAAFMVDKSKNVTGSGRLATVMFEPVGKGETNITLGKKRTAVYDPDFTQTDLGHSYFRNVALADLPTASFTSSPSEINGYTPPEPIEGYNVTFDASASTPDGGSIVEYKWYFGATFPSHRIMHVITETDSTIEYNYTMRTPPGGVYNVTLTVKDSDDVVASSKDYLIIKAHDTALIDIKLWDVPEAPDNVTIGETAKINVTVMNQGDYNETGIDVTCYYKYPGGSPTLIGTETGISVNTTANEREVNATFTWDTSSLTVTDEFYTVWANASLVNYEYEKSDNRSRDLGILIKGRNIAITYTVLWDVAEAPDNVTIGETAKINVTVANQGVQDETGIDVTCYYKYPGGSETLIGTVTDVSVDAGVNVNVTFSWDTSGLTMAGYYDVWANASLLPQEWDEYDNIGSAILVLMKGHNIAIVDTVLWGVPEAPENVTIGETAKINVTIANQGDYDETGIDVNCYYQYPGGSETWIGTETISVSAGVNVNVTFSWDTSGLTVADEYYSVWANASLVAQEWDTADNTGSAIQVYVKPAAVGKLPSSITITASPESVLIDETVTLSGVLNTTREGDSVTIQYRIGGGDWIDITSVLTDLSGQYSYDWSNATPGTYQFRATWPGDADYLPAQSDVVTVVVSKLPSSITITVSPTTVKFGDLITISGGITPVRAAAKVTIWLRPTDDPTWNDIATFQTDENGQYSYQWSNNAATSFELKAVWPGDSITEGAESDFVVVTVEEKEPVDLTLPAVVVVVIIVAVAAVLIYFKKIRKPS